MGREEDILFIVFITLLLFKRSIGDVAMRLGNVDVYICEELATPREQQVL